MQSHLVRSFSCDSPHTSSHILVQPTELSTSLLQLPVFVINSCQVWVQEVNLLEHAASIPHDQRQMQPVRPPPPDVMQQLLGAAANLQTQHTQRQSLQAQVFRPTVALPTVSVEQQVSLQ